MTDPNKTPGKIAVELDEATLDEVRGGADLAAASVERSDGEPVAKQRKQMLTWYKDMQN